MAVLIFEPNAKARLTEISSKLCQRFGQEQISHNIVKATGGNSAEERKGESSSPQKNWMDSSRMIVDSTPVQLTPIQEDLEDVQNLPIVT